MPMISIKTTADAQPWTELERAKVIMASVGDDPDLEASWQGATSWLMPPPKPEPETATNVALPEPTTDAERRLAASYAAVPAWICPPRAA